MRIRAPGLTIATILTLGLGDQTQASPPLKSSVTVTTPPGAELRQPQTGPGVGTRLRYRSPEGYEVEPWFESAEAPTSIPSSPRGVVAILGGSLDFGDRQFAPDLARLVILADSLTISGNTSIDVSGRRRAPGADVMLLARSIACVGAGRLSIVSNGWLAKDGGSLIIAGAGAAVPTCITHTANGGAAVTERVHGHGPGPIGRPPEGVAPPVGPTIVSERQLPPGRPGTIILYPDIEAAVAADPNAAKAASEWILHRLEHLRLSIHAAAGAGDDRKVLELFKEYESITPSVRLVAQESKPQALEILKDLNAYRTTALAPLIVEDLTVSPGGLPRIVTAFTEGSTLESSLAPTNALAVRTLSAGRPVIGLLDYRNDKPDELAIEVDWELTVDPWVEQLAAAAIKSTAKLSGVFAGWALEAKPLQEPGIRSATATLLPGGRRLRMRLVADAASANLVFWRLLNTGGLPWTVDWTYREPLTNRLVTGTWAGPPLSVAHQRTPQVEVIEGKIKNNETSPITINYVRTGEASFVALNPALQIPPGESSVPAGVNGDFRVPAEAVEVAFDPGRVAADFYVVNGEEIVDRVVIRNMLPTSDDVRGAFDRVEIVVRSATPGATETTAASAGPFTLSASGTRGAEITLPMLRLGRGEREVIVSGTAYYSGGSERTIGPQTFDTLSIAITPEMFRQ